MEIFATDRQNSVFCAENDFALLSRYTLKRTAAFNLNPGEQTYVFDLVSSDCSPEVVAVSPFPPCYLTTGYVGDKVYDYICVFVVWVRDCAEDGSRDSHYTMCTFNKNHHVYTSFVKIYPKHFKIYTYQHSQCIKIRNFKPRECKICMNLCM